jgi:SAM-dependent methyltransferase
MTDPIANDVVRPRVPAYRPLERLQVSRPCDRIGAIQRVCKGKSVLDLGAMDETAFLAKQGRGTWLHEEIALVASKVVGIDSSPLLHADGMQTAPNAKIYPGDIMTLDLWLEDGPLEGTFKPDVIVAGELIEHLHNPLLFLQKMKAINRLRGKLLVLTTPNATAVHNCLIGLASRESTHHDHLCILSYKTLSTLCNRAGFSDWIITPYYARFEEMKARQKGFGKPLVAVAEKIVNGLEWMFPLMSFGYIVTVTI